MTRSSRVLAAFDLVQRDVQIALVVHGLAGIDGQVQGHLGQLVRIGHHLQVARGHRAIQTDPTPLGGDVLADLQPELGHEIRGTEALQARRPHPGIGQEVVDDGVDPGAFLQDQFEKLFLITLQLQFVLQHFHTAADAGQGVADLVGDAGRQFTDGRQTVGLADPGGHFLFPGQVGEDGDGSDDLAVAGRSHG